jgi:hypothetical protein
VLLFLLTTARKGLIADYTAVIHGNTPLLDDCARLALFVPDTFAVAREDLLPILECGRRKLFGYWYTGKMQNSNFMTRATGGIFPPAG